MVHSQCPIAHHHSQTSPRWSANSTRTASSSVSSSEVSDRISATRKPFVRKMTRLTDMCLVRKAFRALIPDPPNPTAKFDDLAGPSFRATEPSSSKTLEDGTGVDGTRDVAVTPRSLRFNDLKSNKCGVGRSQLRCSDDIVFMPKRCMQRRCTVLVRPAVFFRILPQQAIS